MNRRTILLGMAGLTSGLLGGEMLSGCGGGNGDSGMTTRAQVGSLRITLSTSKTAFARGEAVPLVFTMTNTGLETIVMYTPKDSPQPADFAVNARSLEVSSELDIWSTYYEAHPDGTRRIGDITSDCSAADAICLASFQPIEFAPGQSRRNILRWAQNANGPAGVRAQVTPGKYRITVSADVIYAGEDRQFPGLGTDPLTITIR